MVHGVCVCVWGGALLCSSHFIYIFDRQPGTVFLTRNGTHARTFTPRQALAVEPHPLAQLLPAGAGPHGLGLAPLHARVASALFFLGLALGLAGWDHARRARSARTLICFNIFF